MQIKRQKFQPGDVSYGSWLCENTLARDCDSINIFQKALLGTRSVAGRYYFGGLRKILLAASQIFAFLHSQGHKQTSDPPIGDVRFSNRPFGVKHFQTIRRCSVDVAHGLVLLFGIGTRALPSWDSRTKWSDLRGGLTV